MFWPKVDKLSLRDRATPERNLRALMMLHAHGNEYSREIPSVTLSGIWLKEAGFRPDDRVSAELTDDGKLAVTKQASDQQMKKTAPSADCFRVMLFMAGIGLFFSV